MNYQKIPELKLWPKIGAFTLSGKRLTAVMCGGALSLSLSLSLSTTLVRYAGFCLYYNWVIFILRHKVG